MTNPKYGTAEQRSRSRVQRAAWQREDGIPDREPMVDLRQPFPLLLNSAGFHDLNIEPRLGYVSWRAVDIESGEVLHCAALKELLHWIADRLPRMLAARNYQ
jgi:hypothetical protein